MSSVRNTRENGTFLSSYRSHSRMNYHFIGTKLVGTWSGDLPNRCRKESF
jgi:hypothetical protein